MKDITILCMFSSIMKDDLNNKSRSVSDVFDELVKKLALDEFPTGPGNWRNNLTRRSDHLESRTTNDANLSTVESLKDLINDVPFKKDLDWSMDASFLQHQSIEKGKNAKYHQNIHKYFRKLRIVGNSVDTIDQDLKKFTHLEELTLSANNIEYVDSKLLPRSLKVLELCGNSISDIGSLCLQPPDLQHLGLSYNKFVNISEFMKKDCWSNLLSLDLSFNHLNDMKSTVTALASLQKLRCLVLQGNPIYLFVGYRGFIIDSIEGLTSLDDIRISADERHHFKGLSKIEKLPLDDMCLIVKIDGLKGLAKPAEAEHCGEDYPRYFVKYRIEIEFITDFDEDDGLNLEPGNKVCNLVITHNDVGKESCVGTELLDGNKELKVDGKLQTSESEWTEDECVHLEYNRMLISKNTSMFHEYVKKKMQMQLIESRVLMSDEPKPCDLAKNLCIDSQRIAKGRSSKPVGKATSNISAKKMKDGKDDKSKKGKTVKQDNTQLFEWSRASHTLATCEINCQSLLEGTFAIDEDCLFETVLTDTNSFSVGQNKCSASKPESKKKSVRDIGRRSVRSVASVKGHKVNNSKAINETPEENADQDIPLSVHFYMELFRWKSMNDGLLWLQTFEKRRH